jgi:hypothetical protein
MTRGIDSYPGQFENPQESGFWAAGMSLKFCSDLVDSRRAVASIVFLHLHPMAANVLLAGW